MKRSYKLFLACVLFCYSQAFCMENFESKVELEPLSQNRYTVAIKGLGWGALSALLSGGAALGTLASCYPSVPGKSLMERLFTRAVWFSTALCCGYTSYNTFNTTLKYLKIWESLRRKQA